MIRKEWFFDRFCGEQLVVYAENGRIVEVGTESEREGSLQGNIYKGRVASLIPGMQAAFIACGMERNCYLPLDEGAARFSLYDGEGNVQERLSLQEGDEILVQVVKPSRGSKGAKVSCDLSFVGKTLIYLPQTDFLGISRKIVREETREALLKEAEKLRKAGEGIILRTAAATATSRHIRTELEYLRRIARSVFETARTAPVGTAVYRECGLHVKIMRDSLGDDISRIYVGDENLYEKVLLLARLRPDLGEKKVVHYTGPRSMFAQFGLDKQVQELADAQITLENGAYLVLEQTEAMTVIDVNTGKYIGDSDLESTVFETNLSAAREIARQVRLRNIGGIVAVDFIDMTEERHRAAVVEELERALSADRAKCRVQPMNELCITLFTRKRTHQSLSCFLHKPCPQCKRSGYVLSDRYLAMRLRSALMDCFAEGYRSAVVEVAPSFLQAIFSERYFSRETAGEWRDKRIYLLPEPQIAEGKFSVHGHNEPVLTLPDDARLLY